MQAGKLRHRVALEGLVAGSPQQHDTGEPDVSFTESAAVWADVRPLSGRQLLAAQQIASEVTTEIEIRYRAGVTAGMRVVHGSTVYEIKAVVNPEGRNIRLLLQCAQGLTRG